MSLSHAVQRTLEITLNPHYAHSMTLGIVTNINFLKQVFSLPRLLRADGTVLSPVIAKTENTEATCP
jgi:hypothetical protein